MMWFLRLLRKWMERFHRFGANHFTIMLIPHSEKKIFSFQVSNYVIFFFMGLMVFSIFGIYHYYATKQALLEDLNEVIEADATYWEKHREISQLIDENKSHFNSLRNEFESIFDIIGRNKNSELWQSDSLFNEYLESKSRELRDKYQVEHNLPKPLLSLSALQKNMDQTLGPFNELKKLLEVREEIIEDIPSEWPIAKRQGYKTSVYGKRFSPFEDKYKFHTGVDLAALPRTPIVAAAGGVVSFSGAKAGYGNVVILRHKYGYKTLYGHNYKNTVRIGDKVKKGQKIAELGKTGRSTGYHVHFEVKINGVAVDPWPYITTKL